VNNQLLNFDQTVDFWLIVAFCSCRVQKLYDLDYLGKQYFIQNKQINKK
jgi:hypothetical protein